MSSEVRRRPVLLELYQQFLADEDAAAFVHRVSRRYNAATLCRLIAHRSRLVRRATVLALGYIADFRSNASLGRVLSDSDRGVRLLAENAIRSVWVRQGKEAHRREINAIMALNTGKQFEEARDRASRFIAKAHWFAEGWNQRAIANYCTERYEESIKDCTEALALNPYHFGAAAGMGQSYLKLGAKALALESFRRALKLNPNLEGVRANVVYLERVLKQSSSD
jgi:tetratricopeptide (TPR) repeat protein